MSDERPTLFTGVPTQVWYAVTDLQGSQRDGVVMFGKSNPCIGVPVFMSREYVQAMAVFQGYMPPRIDAKQGDVCVTLCEFRVSGDGWVETRVLYERRKE